MDLTGRLRKVGYTGKSAGENLGWDADGTAAVVVQAWIDSPGHKANMLRAVYRYAGVGVAIGVPDPPPLPGSTYTLHLGNKLR